MAINREPNKKDFWSWAEEGVGTPMGADVKSSLGEPTPAPLGPSAMDQQLNSMMLSKGIETTAAGIGGALGPTAAAEGMAAAVGPGAATGAGSQAAMLAAQNAGFGALAPEAAALTAEALGASAAATTAATTGAATTAGAGALGAGGSAAMAAMGPVGWTIGGLMLAKQFGLF